MESVFELYDDSEFGRMCRRYVELSDYNTDLLTLLESDSDISVISKKANVFGLNPLLPMSVIEWTFR